MGSASTFGELVLPNIVLVPVACKSLRRGLKGVVPKVIVNNSERQETSNGHCILLELLDNRTAAYSSNGVWRNPIGDTGYGGR
jgi:hypothetical protein